MILAVLIGWGLHGVRAKEQRQRIALLGRHLSRFEIEKMMERLTTGYMRVLEEADAERRAQAWALLAPTEVMLAEQFAAFARDLAGEPEPPTRVSRIPIALPGATQWSLSLTFDVRKVMALHAHGIRDAVGNVLAQSPKGKAYTLCAELFLMQHSCHWFCKSKAVASARLLARHQTSYEQVLASVAPKTRQAYLALTGQGAAL